MRLFRVLFGCAALGLGCTLILLVIIMVAFDGETARKLIFGYSPAIFIIAFGAPFYPYLNKNLK
jgi:hypothetical protein